MFCLKSKIDRFFQTKIIKKHNSFLPDFFNEDFLWISDCFEE